MQPIDLVKHQTRILPGLEEAAHAVIGRLNETREILNLTRLVLIEDQSEKEHYITISKGAAEEIRQSAMRYHRRKKEAEEVRERAARGEFHKPPAPVPVKTLVKRRAK
jgi:hypothetical protein